MWEDRRIPEFAKRNEILVALAAIAIVSVVLQLWLRGKPELTELAGTWHSLDTAIPRLSLWGVLFGFAVIGWCGPLVRRCVLEVDAVVPLDPPDGVEAGRWERTVRVNDAGAVVGMAERAAFLASLLAGWPQFIAIWFAFKVASKWEARHAILRIPDTLRSDVGADPAPARRRVDAVSYLGARNRWATWGLERFLAGTLLNLLAAAVGFVAALVLSGLGVPGE